MGALEIHNKHWSVGTKRGWQLAWNLIMLTRYRRCMLSGFLLPDSFCHFARWKPIQKFLRNASIYLSNRNPPTAQVELTAGYLDCGLEFGELEFPLNLTV